MADDYCMVPAYLFYKDRANIYIFISGKGGHAGGLSECIGFESIIESELTMLDSP